MSATNLVSEVECNSVLDKISCIFELEATDNETNKVNSDGKKRYGNELIAIEKFHLKLQSHIDHLTNGNYSITEKIDGTCRLIHEGKVWKRRDLKMLYKGNKKGQYRDPPKGWQKFSHSDLSDKTKSNHNIGFMPLNQKDNDDKWDFEAHHPEDKFKILIAVPTQENSLFSDPSGFEFKYINVNDPNIQDKTFELVGHKIGNNPYNMNSEKFPIKHCYIQHGINKLNLKINDSEWNEPATIHKKINNFFIKNSQIEGIVLHIHNKEQICFKIHRLHYQLTWK